MPNRTTRILSLAALSTPLLSAAPMPPQSDTRWTVDASIRHDEGIEIEENGIPLPDMNSDSTFFSLAYDWDIGKNGSLETKLYRRERSFEFNAPNSPSYEVLDLFSTGIETAYIHPLSSQWTSITALDLGWHRFHDDTFGSDSLGFAITAAFQWSQSENLNFLFGVHYDSLALSGESVQPFLGVNWLPSPDWQLSFGFPETGIFYQVNDSFRVGFELSADLENYQRDFIRKGYYQAIQLEYTDLRAGFRFDYQITKNYRLSLALDASGYRKIETSESSFDIKSDNVSGGGATLSFIGKF